MFVTAVVVDPAWSPRFELSAREWQHLVDMLAQLDELCAEHGLTQALHPHVGTLVETAADVATVLERSTVRWCLDTGHLLIGGYDPAKFAAEAADRVVHVHLKDVSGQVAERVAGGELSIQAGVGERLFRPLGQGDVPIDATVDVLEAAGYDGWYVLEQDTDLGPVTPPAGGGPIDDVRASIEYLARRPPADSAGGRAEPTASRSTQLGSSTVSMMWTVALAVWMSPHTTIAGPLPASTVTRSPN